MDIDISNAPSYYIKNYNKCDDPYAIFIFDRILSHTNKLILSKEIDEVYENMPVRNATEINNGHCEYISVATYNDIVESNFNEKRSKIINRVWKNYGPGKQLHSWIRYTTKDGNEYHFDSECLWGVQNWIYLPTIFRRIDMIEYSRFHDQHPLEDPYNDVRGFYGLKNK
jgi:hypothetical protein